jgi:hypothetical protein
MLSLHLVNLFFSGILAGIEITEYHRAESNGIAPHREVW